MPRLITSLEANILTSVDSEVLIGTIKGMIGIEDYIKIYGLEAYIQNFSKVITTEDLNHISDFGLQRNKRETFIDLSISF